MNINMRRMGVAGVLAAVVGVLILGGSAQAQQTGSPLAFVLGPSLVGTAYIGQTLTAADGTWRSPVPAQTFSRWEWWHCPSAGTTAGCTVVLSGGSTTYAVTEADRGSYIRAARYVCYPLSNCNPRTSPGVDVLLPSAAKGPVTDAPPPRADADADPRADAGAHAGADVRGRGAGGDARPDHGPGPA